MCSSILSYPSFLDRPSMLSRFFGNTNPFWRYTDHTHTHTFTQNNIIIYSLVLKLLCLSVENLGQYIINWTVGIPTVQLLVDDRFNLSTNSTSLQIINIQTIHVQSLKYTLIPYHKIFFCYYTNINCYYCYYAKNLNRVRPDILQ